MSRSASEPEVVLNEFLRLYLADRDADEERSLEAYQALFPDHGELIERELAALRGEVREGDSLPFGLDRAGEDPGHATRTAPRSAAGKRFGAYLLERPLGQGGQGLVWLARDTRLDRPVALKLLTQLAALSDQALERFQREAQISSRLDDPGICAIYESGSEHGVHFIAMRYVEGDSLATLLDRARASEPGAPAEARFPALPGDPDEGSGERVQGVAQSLAPWNPAPPSDAAEAVERAVRLFERLARSLHRAHEAGVVHRDIKPGNIMVARNGHPVLLDFGLAGVLDESLPSFTRTGDVFGTPAYMAPEQLVPGKGAEGVRVDRRTDIYALGATLYECLTLRHPFESVTREALYQAIRELEPGDPRRTNPAIDADLWTILQTCLAKERGRRYQNALELADDLRRFREKKPIRAHPPSRLYLAKRFVRRYRTLVAATLIVVVALATATLLATSGLFRARRAETAATLAADAEGRLRVEAQASAEEASRQRDRARAGEHAARRGTYTAHMQLAFTAWEKRNWNRVLQLLELQVPRSDEADLRGFEWYCLWRLCHAGLLARHTDPDGAQPVALALGSDGASFLTLDAHGRATRRRTSDGVVLDSAQLRGFLVPGASRQAFSQDGLRLAVFDGDLRAPAIDVWATEGWRNLLHLETASHGVETLALSQDGRRLAWIEQGNRVVVLDVEHGRRVLEQPAGIEFVRCLEFHPDATLLAIGGGNEPRSARVRLLDLASGQEAGRFEGNGRVEALDFSRDGQRLAIGGQEWIARVLEVPALRELAALEGHQGHVSALRFSPDGRRLATLGGSDSTLRLWDLERQEECSTLRAVSVPFARCLAFTAQGDQLLSAGLDDRSVSLWTIAEASAPLEIAAPLDLPHDFIQLSLLAFSPDSKTLALNARDGALDLLDVSTRTTRATLESGAHVTCALFSTDGSRLVLGTKAGELALWDPQSAQNLVRTQAHAGQIDDLALSPDGRRVASCGQDGRIALWDLDTLADLGEHFLHGGEAFSVLFDPTGTGVWSSTTTELVRWDSAGAQEPLVLPMGIACFKMLRAPLGGIATVRGDWTPRLHDGEMNLRTTFAGHAGGSYRALAFSADGRTLATGSVDRTVKLWQVESGEELCTLEFAKHVHSLAFSPDARWLATWSCDGLLKLWPAVTPEELARLGHGPATDVPFSSGALELRSPWQASGGQAQAWFGAPVAAAGDVDGDGFDDCLIGAPHFASEHELEGAAFLYRGSAAGPSRSADWRATGGAPRAEFAHHLAAAGDVNGDGLGDVIVARGDQLALDPGGAALFLGGADGLTATPAWSLAGDQAGAFLGHGISGAGDVNGDGFDDVLVGASGDAEAAKGAGRAFLFHGSARGPRATPTWTAHGPQEGARFAQELAGAGDVNGDGFDDVLIGAFGFDGSWIDEGKVFLYLGSAHGLAREPVWSHEGGQPYCAFGYFVAAAGDVDGDHLDDVLVAAPQHDVRLRDEGKVFLFLGAPDGRLLRSTWSPEGLAAKALFGSRVTGTGDVNGDGFDDVLVGAEGFDFGLPEEGAAFLYLGSAEGPGSVPAWTGRGGQPGAHFGNSLSGAGDVDGDGLDDFLVGSYAYDDTRAEGGGRAQLFLGRSAVPSTTAPKR